MELPNIMHPVAKLSTALAAALMLSGCMPGEIRPGYRKYKPPFCSSSEVSYLKFPHSFTAQAPILTAGPA